MNCRNNGSVQSHTCTINEAYNNKVLFTNCNENGRANFSFTKKVSENFLVETVTISRATALNDKTIRIRVAKETLRLQ